MAGEGARAREVRRRASFVLALLLIASGLAILGKLGWEIWGTNWQSQRTHQRIVQQLQQGWERKRDRVETAAGQADAVIKIPRFGDDYAVPLMEGVSDDALAAGFGHFADAAEPGGRGNFAVAGHRITHGEPLRDMPSLEPGDEVIVETRDEVFTYVLDTPGDGLTVTFRDGWVVDRKPVNPDADGVGPIDAARLLTLTTCAELFHTDDRLIAFGHLVSRVAR